MTAVENLALATGPIIVGAIQDHWEKGSSERFFWVLVFLIIVTTMNLVFMVALFFSDLKHGGILLRKDQPDEETEGQSLVEVN